ncbi:MAG TPA: helix-turn-helix domain-containing protein [Puia sp.]
MPVEQFNMEKGYAVFSRGNYQTGRHFHYAIEIVFAGKGSFGISTGLSEYANLQSVIIPSNLPHSFSCLNADCNLLFLDPLSDMGLFFLQEYDLNAQKTIIADPPGLDPFHKKGKFDIPLILESAKTIRTRPVDSRISACMQAISSSLTDEELTVSQLSKVSFLSESRLAHLFREQLGISVHQCILWKKIMLAVLKSGEGYSLTECAHYAGFSDSSHFNKVFYRMFGVNPFFVLKT